MKTSLKSIRATALCASLAWATSLTWAQAAGGTAVPAKPAAAKASAPAAAASPGAQRGARRGPRWDAGNTSGWSMMTPAERDAHRQRMGEMNDLDDCVAYMDRHHQQMMERAKEKGLQMPARPRRDGCVWLKP